MARLAALADRAVCGGDTGCGATGDGPDGRACDDECAGDGDRDEDGPRADLTERVHEGLAEVAAQVAGGIGDLVAVGAEVGCPPQQVEEPEPGRAEERAAQRERRPGVGRATIVVGRDGVGVGFGHATDEEDAHDEQQRRHDDPGRPDERPHQVAQAPTDGAAGVQVDPETGDQARSRSGRVRRRRPRGPGWPRPAHRGTGTTATGVAAGACASSATRPAAWRAPSSWRRPWSGYVGWPSQSENATSAPHPFQGGSRAGRQTTRWFSRGGSRRRADRRGGRRRRRPPGAP